jgi:hypothetical protein
MNAHNFTVKQKSDGARPFFPDSPNHRDVDALFLSLISANVWRQAHMTGNNTLNIAMISWRDKLLAMIFSRGSCAPSPGAPYNIAPALIMRPLLGTALS